MPTSTTNQLLVLALLAGTGACSEPTSVTQDSARRTVTQDLRPANDDYVPTPAGWYHRSCVHQVEDGASVRPDGVVTRKDKTSYRVSRCAYPVRATKEGPAATTPTINGWLEWASRSQPSGSWYRTIRANWNVPLQPLGRVVGSSQTYFTFPGLQSTFIIQPVLQYGQSAAGGGEGWTMASWRCHSSMGCFHSSLKGTTPGHTLIGTVEASNCAGANCTWTITTRDATSNVQTVLTATDTYNYWWGVGGSVEVYGLTSCDQFPTNGVFFNNIALYDQNSVLLSPNWTRSMQGNPSPSCSFGVTSTTTTVNLLHNPATVTATGGLAASCASLCNGAWLTQVTASGNQLTWRDNQGHTGVMTLAGATASGSFSASCGLLCSNSWIRSITVGSPSTIRLTDNGGHVGTITLSGATVSGPGLGASCGVTCSNAWISRTYGYGANGFQIFDNGGNRGYIRFN